MPVSSLHTFTYLNLETFFFVIFLGTYLSSQEFWFRYAIEFKPKFLPILFKLIQISKNLFQEFLKFYSQTYPSFPEISSKIFLSLLQNFLEIYFFLEILLKILIKF